MEKAFSTQTSGLHDEAFFKTFNTEKTEFFSDVFLKPASRVDPTIA